MIPARLRATWDGLSANVRGALTVILGGMILVTMTTMVKTLGTTIHSFEIVFVRCLIGFLVLSPLLFKARGAGFRTRRPVMQFLRAAFGMVAMFCGFWSVTHMPLADATAIGFSRPLFMIVLAMVFLGEVVGWRRALATIAGFTGILIMARPFTEGFEPVALVAASGALSAAIAVVIIKKLAASDSVMTTMIHYTFWTTVIAAIPAAMVWQTPSLTEAGLLLLVGILGVAGQTAMTQGFMLGEATFVVPFDYLRLIYATIFGIALFSETPTFVSIIGASIIVASSFYILKRSAPRAPA